MRFTIVTPTLNRREMLVEALDSVARQGWPEIEHIVVDGGSTDGTLELVASRPELRLIGGPDRGIYDALNKGIAAASGDVVGLLNSDDLYEPGAFAAAAATFAAVPDCDSVCGAARLVCEGNTVEVYDLEADKRLSSARTALLGSCMINARFFRRKALDRIGPFSTDFRIVSDRDFLMRAVTLELKSEPTDALVYTYQRHHASLSFSGEAAQRPAIWRELLSLARYWADSEAATPAGRRVARSLEGRCLGRLIQRDLAEGRPGDAWRLLSQGGQGMSRNLTAIVSGVMDATSARIAVLTALR